LLLPVTAKPPRTQLTDMGEERRGRSKRTGRGKKTKKGAKKKNQKR